jgi:hypothetical protein
LKRYQFAQAICCGDFPQGGKGRGKRLSRPKPALRARSTPSGMPVCGEIDAAPRIIPPGDDVPPRQRPAVPPLLSAAVPDRP